MNCSEYEILITDYLENKCTPGQHRQMELHLSECNKCRAMAAHERSVIDRLSTIAPALCPDEVIDHVMKNITSQRISPADRLYSWIRIKPLWKYGIAPLAGTSLIVVLALLFYMPYQNSKKIKHHEFTATEIKQAKAGSELALAYFSIYSKKTKTVLKEARVVERVNKSIELKLKKVLKKSPYLN